MRLEQACQPVFARHETFHPRYGWVKKAVDAASDDPNLFNADKAVVSLGVGKNMVRSIRHWGLAFRVLASAKAPGSRKPQAVPSLIGETMFSDVGWDPYVELPGTLWLLHWWLLAPGASPATNSYAPVWWLAFNDYPGIEFTDEQLEQFVADRTRDWADPHPSAVKKDVSCLLRMYATGHSKRATFDDLIDGPFRDLDLFRPSHVAGTYRSLIGAKPTLPPSIATFAALDFLARSGETARTVTISKLATEPGGPGRAFKLPETDLLALLSNAADVHSEIDVTTANGVPQLTLHEDAPVAGTEILFDHYRRVGENPRRPSGDRLLCGPGGDAPARHYAELDFVGATA